MTSSLSTTLPSATTTTKHTYVANTHTHTHTTSSDHNTGDWVIGAGLGLDVENEGWLAADFESLVKYGSEMPRTEESGIMTKAG